MLMRWQTPEFKVVLIPPFNFGGIVHSLICSFEQRAIQGGNCLLSNGIKFSTRTNAPINHEEFCRDRLFARLSVIIHAYYDLLLFRLFLIESKQF